jgi:ribosomal protein L2
MTRASLAVERMTDRGLWARLLANHVRLSSYGYVEMKSSEVRAMATECQAIALELKLRGVQLSLAG